MKKTIHAEKQSSMFLGFVVALFFLLSLSSSNAHAAHKSLMDGKKQYTYFDNDYNSYTLITQGFRQTMDLTNPKILCQMQSGTCSPQEKGIQFPAYPVNNNYQVKIYLPKGTMSASFKVQSESFCRVAAVARFGEVPANPNVYNSFSQFPESPLNGQPLSEFVGQDGYAKQSDSTFVKVLSCGLDTPLSTGGWFYVNVKLFEGSLSNFFFNINVHVDTYLNWYRSVENNSDCWATNGDPIEGCSGGGVDPPPPDGFTFTGHVVAVFPGITQIAPINLPNMKVKLRNKSTSQTLDTTTNSSGVFSYNSDNYNFDDGLYTLRIEPPNSIWAEYFSPVDYDGDFTISSQTTGTIGPDEDVIIPINAGGACVPDQAALSGTVQGSIAGQQPVNLQGIIVKLTGTDENGNNISTSTTSSSTGDYSFHVDPGDYTVEFIDPNGNFTQPAFSVHVEEDTVLPSLDPTLRLVVPRDCLDFTPSHSLEKALENLEVINNKK